MSYHEFINPDSIQRAISRLETLRSEMRDGDSTEAKLWAGDLMGVILMLRQALE